MYMSEHSVFHYKGSNTICRATGFAKERVGPLPSKSLVSMTCVCTSLMWCSCFELLCEYCRDGVYAHLHYIGYTQHMTWESTAGKPPWGSVCYHRAPVIVSGVPAKGPWGVDLVAAAQVTWFAISSSADGCLGIPRILGAVIGGTMLIYPLWVSGYLSCMILITYARMEFLWRGGMGRGVICLRTVALLFRYRARINVCVCVCVYMS